jgi:hypothetical protein
MHPGGRWIQISLPLCRQAGPVHLVTAVLLVGLVAGCASGSHQASTTQKVTACGSARTAANVPIHVEVTKGNVGCGTALTIEKQYASAIRSGKAPGNGGGGPVRVNGWTCQGYSTPVVLRTGKASRCTEGGSEILAILPSTS